MACKRTTTVRRHIRRTPFGRTTVKKHKRSILSFLKIIPEGIPLSKEIKSKDDLGLITNALLELMNAVPEPRRKEILREHRRIKKEHGIRKALDNLALGIQQELVAKKGFEKKYGKLPALKVGTMDFIEGEGQLVGFDFKRKKFIVENVKKKNGKVIVTEKYLP